MDYIFLGSAIIVTTDKYDQDVYLRKGVFGITLFLKNISLLFLEIIPKDTTMNG